MGRGLPRRGSTSPRGPPGSAEPWRLQRDSARAARSSAEPPTGIEPVTCFTKARVLIIQVRAVYLVSRRFTFVGVVPTRAEAASTAAIAVPLLASYDCRCPLKQRSSDAQMKIKID